MDEDVIFESSVIIEFLEEAFANKLHPADLIQRAKNRSWIEFSSPCLAASFNLSIAEDKPSFEGTMTDLNNRFDQIEAILINEPYFNGEQFSLVDASYAPLFHRLHCMNELNPGLFLPDQHPKVNRWKDRLLQERSVIDSTVSNFTELYRELLWTRHGYISTFLDATQYKPVESKSHY
jgi:glutathione S-transferase